MKSYTVLRNLYGSLTVNTAGANLTLGDQLINDHYRSILGLKDWPFLRRLRTLTTTASTQFYNLPYDVNLVESIYVTVGSTRYTPRRAPSREFWDNLNTTSYTSDIPEYYIVYNGQLGIWPTPASSSNTISVNAKVNVIDLNTADITSTTIATLANGGTALTVSAGLTAQMVGFWIRPTFSTTANTGDGRWYEISAVASATAATLARGYGGVSISIGTAASTISQMPLLPEAYHHLPVYGAASVYWATNALDGSVQRADRFKRMYDEGVKALIAEHSSADADMVLDYGDDPQMINPNLTISL